MEPAPHHGFGRLRHGRGTVRAQRRGQDADQRSGLSEGNRYLLRTQAADGSWHVKSRSIWLQPYFESGFPYGHDQWISAAGTAWAVMALSLAAEPVSTSRIND